MVIPVVKFPTRILIIDDDKTFAKSLSVSLKFNKINNLFYTNPLEAIDYLLADKLFNIFNNSINQEYNKILEQEDFNLKNLINHKFHDLISVIIIDFSMPNINGLEVCEKISHLPCKKILLTAHHDHKMAVNAFNKNLIDSFVLKDEDNLEQKLLNIIKKLELNFFTDLLSPIFTAVNNLSNNLLSNKNYQELCKKYINKHKSDAFYLTDDSGSININNKILSIANKEKLASFIELAELNNIAKNNLEKIKNGEQIPVFNTNKNTSNWNDILYPAQKIMLEDGDELCYCLT